MTLARTALRLATIAALKGPDASTGPTIARNRVYDSRISDFSPETYPADALPSVIVLTDEDEGDALSDQNGGPPFHRMINLVIEFAMVQGFDVPVEEGGTVFVPGYPATDAEHEASLDLLEFQIKTRLAVDLTPFPTLWRSFTRVWKYDCHRQVLDDQGVKIAARVLTWQVEVSDDKVKTYNSGLDFPTYGLDLLPEPLRTVALALPQGSASRNLCLALAGQLAPAITAVPFDGMNMVFVPQDLRNMFDVSMEILSGMDTPEILVAPDGSAIFDYNRGTFQHLILSANCTSLSVVNWPRNSKTGRLIIKVTNVGAFAIAPSAWPAGTKWVNDAAPTITTGAGSIDIIVLVTGSAGQEIFGNVAGQNYQPA